MRFRSGFTLIETLVYLALFSIIIGGVLVAAYNLTESSGRTGDKATIETDGSFVLGKLSWALGGVSSSIILPAVGTSSGTLSFNRLDVSINPLTFALDGGGHIMLARGAGTSTPLTSDNVTASALLFTRSATTGTESIVTQFTLTGKISRVAEQFTITKYLRK